MRPALRLAGLALACLVATGLALAVALGGSSGHSSQSASTSGFDGALLPPIQHPAPFTLIDQHGRRISLSDYRGQVSILTFLSTTHDRRDSLLIAQQIRGALEELGTPTPVLAVSTDPRADTQGHVRDFLRRVALTGRLEYLTGTRPQLSRAWRSYAIVPPAARERGPDRSAYVLLLDRRGVQRVRFYVEQLTPEALAHDIRKLQAG